jgi:mannose-1-phosphate guanylyltransferase
MKALILAAGEGTRLRPLTLTRPKPMVPIGDRPLLAITVDQLRSRGITNLAINLHYHPETITDYFGDGADFGVHITYSHEPALLGTAGAAKQLQPFLDETFVVVYGDVLTNLDYGRLIRFHRDARALLTLSLYHVDNPTEVGLVALDDVGRLTRFLEKPRPEDVFSDLANSGILVCEPAILSSIPPATFYDFGHHLLPQLLGAGQPVYGLPVAEDEYLIDIGTPEKYQRVQEEWPTIEAKTT